MKQQDSPQKDLVIQTSTVSEDLSDAINQSVERQPNEEVRSVRVFEDCYRCNWWVKEKSNHWMSFSSGIISKSRFLRVSKIADKLIIQDLSNHE
jgi:hypothetical protein